MARRLIVCAAGAVFGLMVHNLVADAQDTRVVKQPTTPAPPYCQVLHASLPRLSQTAFVPPRAFDDATEASPPDTARINQAILTCSQISATSGFATPQVVELAAGSGENVSFLSGPIVMQSGVTLLIDPGVTLYASRNANEYYNGAGGTESKCGQLDASSGGCKNWITISGSSRRAKNLSFIGPGTIDGRGDAVIAFSDGTGGGKNQTLPCASSCTWWDLAHQADILGTNQNNPRLMQLSDADNTIIYNLNLRNSPKFHIAAQRLNGVTIWGVSIASPEGRSRNSDAIDPNGWNWTITQSYIDVDDDDVAIKGGTAISNGFQYSAQYMTIAHNHFYSGHGMSIGSETNTGVADILVNDLTIDGADNGLRIKSDRSRGGTVERVFYNDVCMRNIDRRNTGGGALLFSAYYTPNAVGTLYPNYKDIRVHNTHNLTPSNQFFVGYDAAHPLNIQLDNVMLENQDPAKIFASDTNATLGPGPVNFGLSGTDVTVINQITDPDARPVDCTNRFVPFVAAGMACDANGDGIVDHTDIAAIAVAIGYSVFPNDPRDADGDGIVTGKDVAACARAMTVGRSP
jgi:polygalacturonase